MGLILFYFIYLPSILEIQCIRSTYYIYSTHPCYWRSRSQRFTSWKGQKSEIKTNRKCFFFAPIILTFVPGNINILIMYAYSVLILRFHHMFGQSWIYMENIMIRFAIYMFSWIFLNCWFFINFIISNLRMYNMGGIWMRLVSDCKSTYQIQIEDFEISLYYLKACFWGKSSNLIWIIVTSPNMLLHVYKSQNNFSYFAFL